MKELVEDQNKAIESEAKVKSEVDAAKAEEPKHAPIRIKLPRMKSVIVTPPTPADPLSLEEDTEEDEVPLQSKRLRKRR